jgi:hypothetical protein
MTNTASLGFRRGALTVRVVYGAADMVRGSPCCAARRFPSTMFD